VKYASGALCRYSFYFHKNTFGYLLADAVAANSSSLFAFVIDWSDRLGAWLASLCFSVLKNIVLLM
jgi:hypothetical protein